MFYTSNVLWTTVTFIHSSTASLCSLSYCTHRTYFDIFVHIYVYTVYHGY